MNILLDNNKGVSLPTDSYSLCSCSPTVPSHLLPVAQAYSLDAVCATNYYYTTPFYFFFFQYPQQPVRKNSHCLVTTNTKLILQGVTHLVLFQQAQ